MVSQESNFHQRDGTVKGQIMPHLLAFILIKQEDRESFSQEVDHPRLSSLHKIIQAFGAHFMTPWILSSE